MAVRSEIVPVPIRDFKSPKAISSVKTIFFPINIPIDPASFQGTPIDQASGLNMVPRMDSSEVPAKLKK